MVVTGYRMSLQMQDEALWIRRIAAGDREASSSCSRYRRRPVHERLLTRPETRYRQF